MLPQAIVLHRMRWHIAALRVRVAVARSWLALRAFDPMQPRVPAGDPDGGQWTDAGGGGSGIGQDEGRVRLAENETVRAKPIDLREEERLGGHALRRHVGKTDEQLLSTVRAARMSSLFFTVARIGEGSFATEVDATDLTNRTIEANVDVINERLSRGKTFAIQHRFGYVTGREAFRPNAEAEPYMQKTYEVRVVLRPDSRRERDYGVFSRVSRQSPPPRTVGDGHAYPKCILQLCSQFLSEIS